MWERYGEKTIPSFHGREWKGDHSPRHVHVYKDAKLVVKWDLEHAKAMQGKPTRKVLALINGLEREGLL